MRRLPRRNEVKAGWRAFRPPRSKDYGLAGQSMRCFWRASGKAKAATPEQSEGGPVDLFYAYAPKDYGLAGHPQWNAFSTFKSSSAKRTRPPTRV